ncbi:hypothetical protein ACTXT7_012613 [Hymenolepis weldensis]
MRVNGEFGKYIPTIADEYIAKVTVKNSQVVFNLWDTAGQEEFKNLRKASFPDTDVFLVCFAVDNKDAFRNQTVSYAMGKKMAKKLKLYDYVECSAKTGEGDKSVFDMAIKAGLNPRKFKKRYGYLVM